MTTLGKHHHRHDPSLTFDSDPDVQLLGRVRGDLTHIQPRVLAIIQQYEYHVSVDDDGYLVGDVPQHQPPVVGVAEQGGDAGVAWTPSSSNTTLILYFDLALMMCQMINYKGVCVALTVLCRWCCPRSAGRGR